MNVSANGDGTDSVSLNGNAAQVLTVSSNSPTVIADQNTPKTIHVDIRTSLAGNFSLQAQAPAGWTVAIDAAGNLTLTPAPGLQAGTFPILLVARSTANPDLVARTVINVSVTPTLPAIELTVTPDPGVVEVNMAPCASTQQFYAQALAVWDAAGTAGLPLSALSLVAATAAASRAARCRAFLAALARCRISASAVPSSSCDRREIRHL